MSRVPLCKVCGQPKARSKTLSPDGRRKYGFACATPGCLSGIWAEWAKLKAPAACYKRETDSRQPPA